MAKNARKTRKCVLQSLKCPVYPRTLTKLTPYSSHWFCSHEFRHFGKQHREGCFPSLNTWKWQKFEKKSSKPIFPQDFSDFGPDSNLHVKWRLPHSGDHVPPSLETLYTAVLCTEVRKHIFWTESVKKKIRINVPAPLEPEICLETQDIRSLCNCVHSEL